MKINRKYFCAILVLISIIILCVFNARELGYLIRGEILETKIYYSNNRKNKLTLLLHTYGHGIDYDSYIYLIPGIYKNDKLPDPGNYIKFPDATAIFVKWEKEDSVNIYSDEEPIINTFYSSDYSVNIFVDRDFIDKLKLKQTDVVRYVIK